MCRLAYIPANAPVTEKQLATLFHQLEKSFGGDGNGFATLSDSRPLITKAVKLSAEEIAKNAFHYVQSGKGIFYHTRKISVGWKTDKQCHPFRIVGRHYNGVMCHNGTWYDGGVLARYLNTGSDTATLARLVGEMGIARLQRLNLWPKTGVFLFHGARPGSKPSTMVHLLGGDLAYCPDTGIWASEFGQWWDFDETYDVKHGVYNLGYIPPVRPMRTKTLIQNSSYSNLGGLKNDAKLWDERDHKFDQQAWDDYWDRQRISSRYEDPDPMEEGDVNNDYVTGMGLNGYHI